MANEGRRTSTVGVSITAATVLLLAAACGGSDGSSAARPAPTGPCAGTVQETGSAGRELQAAWSNTFAGSVVSTAPTPTTIYVACEDGPSKRIAAVSTADGTTEWVTTLTPDGEWNGSFAVAATSAGALTSYQDETGAHLVLLDASSGSQMWTHAIDEPAFELEGGVAAGVAVVDLTEWDAELVDLASGSLRPAAGVFLSDGRYTTVDGTTLEVGGDPFDAAKPGTTIELTSEPTAADAAGDLIVVAEGDDVVGVVDGGERWRVPAGIGPVAGLGVLGRYVLAIADSEDPSVASPVAVIALDPTPRLAGRLPESLDVNTMASFELDPHPVVVGVIDPTPGGADVDEVDQLDAVALTADGPEVVRSVPVSAMALMSSTSTEDRYVWVDDGRLHALSVPELHDGADVDIGADASTIAAGRSILIVDDHTLTWVP
jgi:hypothetical protein